MPRYSFPEQNAGTDWLRFQTVQFLNTTISATTVETDIVNVSGKGFLEELHFVESATNNTTIKVYIDGVLQWTAIIPAASNQSGVITSKINIAGTTLQPYYFSPCIADAAGISTWATPSRKAFPVTSGAGTATVTVINTGLPFKTSLRITTTSVAGTSSLKGFVDYKIMI